MSAKIKTKFTERFGLDHPIMLAPMALISGGELAAAVSKAGGLGMIGGGYGDRPWVEQAFTDAGNQHVGIGYITWSVADKPDLIDFSLARKPKAFMVSFGDATPLIEKAKAAGIPTIWQVQRLDQAEMALAAGVDVLIAQGTEGGGHGMDRALMALLPAVRDLAGPDTIVLAAGGIADGRGLAGALMLGADGVSMGTRFWAAPEASGSEGAKERLVSARGDDAERSKIFDIARDNGWPDDITFRVLKNDYSERWGKDIKEMRTRAAEAIAEYNAASPDDFSIRAVAAGEVVDLIQSVEPAGEIVMRVADEAASLLGNAKSYLV